MNEFDRRWKMGADAARRAAPDLPCAAPFGFATRVVAQRRTGPTASLISVWQRLAWRVLGFLTVVLAAALAVQATLPGDDDPLTPDLGSTVSDLFWMQ